MRRFRWRSDEEVQAEQDTDTDRAIRMALERALSGQRPEEAFGMKPKARSAPASPLAGTL